MLYEEETYKIRGACFRVWKEFGGAFKESVIEKSLIIELQDLGFKVDSQKKILLYYKRVITKFATSTFHIKYINIGLNGIIGTITNFATNLCQSFALFVRIPVHG